MNRNRKILIAGIIALSAIALGAKFYKSKRKQDESIKKLAEIQKETIELFV